MTRLGERGKPLIELVEVASVVVFAVVGFRDVGRADRGFWRHRIHGRPALAPERWCQLGKLLGGFYLTCLIFVFGVLWPVSSVGGIQFTKAAALYQGGTADRLRNHVIGNSIAADDHKAGRPGVRGKRGGPGDSNRLFV